MNLLDLLVKISVDDEATGQMNQISAGMIAKGQLIANGIGSALSSVKDMLVDFGKGALDAYSQYEQLSGGIETFFKSSSETVVSNAKRAFETAGMSANQYMSTVSTFATTLVNSVAQGNAQSSKMSQDEVRQMVASAEDGYGQMQSAFASQLRNMQKEYEQHNRSLSRSLSDQLEAQREMNQEFLDQRREQHATELDDVRDAQESEVEEYQRATDEKIAAINREYTERLKLIDEDEYRRVKAIEEQIKAIENEGKAADEQSKQRERAAKISALKEKEASSMALDDIADARKQLSELTQKYAEEDAKAERKERIDALKEQRQEVKDEASSQRDELREEQKKQVDDYKAARDDELDALRKAHAEQIAEVQKRQQEEIKEIQKAQATQLKEQQRANEDLLQSVRDEQQSELEAVRESQQAQLAERKAAIDQQKQLLAEASGDNREYVEATDEDLAKAAELADRAIIDMADNANKMGTSMGMIQNAYQGFAKDNFTMLDNLKLGYGGTRSEMERLLEDAERISAANGEMRDFSIQSFADIVDAIHVVQQEYEVSGYKEDELKQKLEDRSLSEQEVARVAQDLGVTYEEAYQKMLDGNLSVQEAIVLTGTTSYEASETIEGSMNRASAAWENWLLSLSDPNASLEESTGQLVDSVIVAAENVIPRAVEIVTRLGEAIGEHAPEAVGKLGEAFMNAIPPEFKTAVEDAQSALGELAKHWQPVIDAAKELAEKVFPKLQEAFQYVMENSIVQGIMPALSRLGDAVTHIIEVFGEWVEPLGNVAGILANAFFGAVSIAIEVISVCIDIIADILDALKMFGDFLNDVGKAIGDFVSDAGKFFEDLGKGVDETITDIIDWFEHLPENMLNALGDLGNLLFGAGQDILNGLWDGLLDIWDGLTGWIEGVGEWIADHKGPKQYDLALLVPNGQWIMQGLASGMRKAFPLIEDAVADVTDLMDVGYPGLSVSATKAQLPSAGNVINLYMTYNAGEDARELVYDMVGQLRRYGYTMGGK